MDGRPDDEGARVHPDESAAGDDGRRPGDDPVQRRPGPGDDPVQRRPGPGDDGTVVVGPDGQVSLDVVIEDGGHAGRGRLTVLRFAWRPDDPLAVDLLLSAQPDHPALPRGSWIVLRDFLRYGLTEPTGDGSVRIRPDALRDRVWFELERYGRPACVSVARSRVQAFLDRTEQQVPCGAERSDGAIEDLLTRLLER